MSQADVDLVRALVPAAETDWAAMVRDQAIVDQLAEAVGDVFEPGFRCCISSIVDNWLQGFDGLWAAWREWLEPWESYHVHEEQISDLGDGRVLWLGRDVGGRPDGGGDVTLLSSAIWTLREGKVSRVVFYTNRERALAASCSDA